MHALAGESDHVEMAEMAVAEYEKVASLFRDAGMVGYQILAEEKRDKSRELVKLLEV
jgi:hypothetical protein